MLQGFPFSWKLQLKSWWHTRVPFIQPAMKNKNFTLQQKYELKAK